MTAQRRIILETLQTLTDHPTAEQIYRQARQKDATLSLSTVYRTLRWLEKVDLVSSHQLDDRRQDRFDPPQSEGHHHFCCRQCGKIIEFTDPQLEDIRLGFETTEGAQVESVSLVFTGLCPACSNRK